MKPRVLKLLGILLACLFVAVMLKDGVAHAADKPVSAAGPSASPVPASTPKQGGKHNKGPKGINFPLSVGDTGHDFTLPQLGATGEILSKLMSTKITRLDNERVEMHGTNIDLNHPDGKEDFHVELPDSIFNLKTNIITSDHPVTVRTADFELTGERMQFNTVDRTGELQGHVHMVIHNFKQVAGVIPTTPAP